jgi:hypothetical protein
MTRPIEKVQRGRGCQMSVLCFNLFVLLVFVVAGYEDWITKTHETWQIVGFSISAFFFCSTICFYALTLIDPGYVEPQQNFQLLLDRLMAENYHLDYVCIPCESLRPEDADHCNFCNRCVQKFDHHCVFVNNCLGYRNHKWFLLFLFSFTIYMCTLLIHSAAKLIIFAMTENPAPAVIAFNWSI